MDLRLGGRAKAPLTAFEDGELSEEDLAALATERGTKPPEVKRMRDRHHALARLLAEGVSEAEASLITRYDISRISILKNDPMFQELVSHYRAMVSKEFIDMQKKLASLGMDAADILQERLEEAPDDVSTGQLMQLLTISADRTGNGPSSKTEVNVKVGLADRLAEARQRAIAARTMRDVTPQDK